MELIDKHKLVKITLNKNFKTFIIYILATLEISEIAKKIIHIFQTQFVPSQAI